MNEFLRTCLLVCPLVFLAGFVDSVAGGGGIISIPAYLIAGVPTYQALGTNKLVNMIGTGASSVRYFRGGKVILKIALPAAAGSLAGSLLGTNLALLIPERILKLVLLVLLPVIALFLIRQKSFGAEEGETGDFEPRRTVLLALLIGLGIGLYDGLIGPGTGTFFIMAFTAVFRTDLLRSSGCAKIANLSSNIMSAVVYMMAGKIWYLLAIPAVIFNVAGNLTGTRYALKGGSKNVRKVMFLVLGLLFVRVILELTGAVG
ncbi:MAG: sulfite exporter TauE/SafE family protein [Lachnospiraceae bacterium]|nr:sulfite exporter TauE/SafE family protein [Lachnospiraceae bacterium]